MKNPHDPRHKKRQFLVQELFRFDFYPSQEISDDTKQILQQKTLLDDVIQKAAPEFPVDKINRIDLAILRLASYELLVVKKEPEKVVIDEAIELAKEFGGETSPAFINGALGKVITSTDENTQTH